MSLDQLAHFTVLPRSYYVSDEVVAREVERVSRRFVPGPLHPQREAAIRSPLGTYLSPMDEVAD